MRLQIGFFTILVASGVLAEPADTVLMHGEVYTVNDVQPWAEALAIEDGRIVFVGADADVQSYIGPDTRVINLQGRMAMPGIHDAHQHLMYGGMAGIGCPVPLGPRGDAFVTALQEKLRECRASLEDGEWLVARGFFAEQFPDGVPHRKYLDEVFPDYPVYLIERTHHNGLANSKALELAGVDESTAAPEGGVITRNANGQVTGELVEKATALVQNAIPPPTPSKYIRALRKGIEICHRHGITSIQEAMTTEDVLVALKYLEDRGELHLNVTAHLVWGRKNEPEEVQEALIEQRSKYQSEHVDPNNIKITLDGTPTGPYFTQADLDPETGEPEWKYVLVPPEKLNEFVPRVDALGMKVKMHVAGKGAAHVALDAIERARTLNPESTVRHELAHTALVTASDMDRMRTLNVIGEVSPTQWQLREPFGNPPEDPWEFRSLANEGVLLTMGTDWPVTRTPDFFEALEGMLLFDDQSLDLLSAIRSMTWNGAVAIGREDDMGSLEAGKLANVIILDQNLFAIDLTEISETRVLMTLFEGTVVYESQ
ncbi:amidohydrolase [Elongatibacter sediminis]|uniref:Amidohydrolase n=1 Tax=Elongatibacter sediminis TaxID=3119006 RepID=A0AAW9RG15_9GAMM